jgi:hypothetical protein
MCWLHRSWTPPWKQKRYSEFAWVEVNEFQAWLSGQNSFLHQPNYRNEKNCFANKCKDTTLRSVYTKHEFCVVRANLGRTAKIEALQFVPYYQILCRATHRNLSTRTCMFELLLQTFWAKKKSCKKSADLHPRQGNLLLWNIFTGLNKTSLHFTK